MSGGGVKLAAIVNSRDRLPLLREALASLGGVLAGCGERSVAVVFEAGSTDGSREFLRGCVLPGGVPLEVVEVGAGGRSFSAGSNAACRHAAARYPELEWYFFFETDNWMAGPGPLARALEFLRASPDVGGVGFTVRKHSGEPCGWGCRFPGVAGFLAGPQASMRLGWDRPDCGPMGERRFGAMGADAVYTSPLLVRRAAWDAVGGFDEGEFPFSECDIDLAWRMRRAGWLQGALPEEGVVHDNRERRSAWSARRVLDFHRARLALLVRHRRVWLPGLLGGLALRHLAELAVCLAVPGRGWRERVAKRWCLLRGVFRGYRAPGGRGGGGV